MEQQTSHSGIAQQARSLAEKEGITVASAVEKLSQQKREDAKDTKQT